MGRTTEKFSLETQTWSVGPAIPLGKPSAYTQTLAYEDTFLMFGFGVTVSERSGIGPEIFQFDHLNERWILRRDRLPWPDFTHTVVEIPEP